MKTDQEINHDKMPKRLLSQDGEEHDRHQKVSRRGRPHSTPAGENAELVRRLLTQRRDEQRRQEELDRAAAQARAAVEAVERAAGAGASTDVQVTEPSETEGTTGASKALVVHAQTGAVLDIRNNVLTQRPRDGGDSIFEAQERAAAGHMVVQRQNPQNADPEPPSYLLRSLGTTSVSERARYDRNTMTVYADHFDHRRSNPNRTHARPPMTVQGYIAGGSFDAMRFTLIPLAPYLEGRRGRDAAYGERWAHWSGRGARDSFVTGTCDLPNVRMFEEVDYQRRLARLMERASEDEAHRWPNGSWPWSWSNLCFDRPFDQLWFVGERTNFWYADCSFERRRRSGRTQLFVGWHNVELDDIPASRRHEVFLQVPASFQQRYETGELLGVPSPAVFVYHTALAKYGTPLMRETVYNVAMTEYLACCLIAYLDGSLQGLRPGRSEDDRAYAGYQHQAYPGRLPRIPQGVRADIERLGFFDLVAETNFPPLEAWVAWQMGAVVDWTHGPGYFYYHFASGTMAGVKEFRTRKGALLEAATPRLLPGAIVPTRRDAQAALDAWRRRYASDRLPMPNAGPWPMSGPNVQQWAAAYRPFEDPRAGNVEPREEPAPYVMPPPNRLREPVTPEPDVRDDPEEGLTAEEQLVVAPVPLRASGEKMGRYPSRVSYPPRQADADEHEGTTADGTQNRAELEARQAVCRAAGSNVPRTVRAALAITRRLVHGEHATNTAADADVKGLEQELARARAELDRITGTLDGLRQSVRDAEDARDRAEKMVGTERTVRQRLQAEKDDSKRSGARAQ